MACFHLVCIIFPPEQNINSPKSVKRSFISPKCSAASWDWHLLVLEWLMVFTPLTVNLPTKDKQKYFKRWPSIQQKIFEGRLKEKMAQFIIAFKSQMSKFCRWLQIRLIEYFWLCWFATASDNEHSAKLNSTEVKNVGKTANYEKDTGNWTSDNLFFNYFAFKSRRWMWKTYNYIVTIMTSYLGWAAFYNSVGLLCMEMNIKKVYVVNVASVTITFT